MFPDPPRKVERATFLVTWSRAILVKKVIIAFLNPELGFLMPHSIWTTTQPSLQKLEIATKSIGTAENRLQDKFSLFLNRFKIRSLTSCNYNEVFCNLIGDLKSEIGPPHGTRKVAQNTRPSSHV